MGFFVSFKQFYHSKNRRVMKAVHDKKQVALLGGGNEAVEK